MELQEKKVQKDTGNLLRKNLQLKGISLILDLKPFRSKVKGKHSIGREFQREKTLDIKHPEMVTEKSCSLKE